MKVLFVSSGKSKQLGLSPIVSAQATSLIEHGIDLEFYTISGKGVSGYLKEIAPLSRFIRAGNFDVIHAHYSFSGILATCASYLTSPLKGTALPLVVSLMGSDLQQFSLLKVLIKLMASKLWSKTIAKSQEMRSCIGADNVYVIPNGVSLSVFHEIPQSVSREKIRLDNMDETIVLFGADKQRSVKNYGLAEEALSKTGQECLRVISLGNVPHELVPYYINSSDLTLLTSKWEGSPNIIKEAMACNCPIVCTDVGDVRWLLEGVSGSYVATHDAQDIAEKINRAIEFKGRTNGREKLISLQLDSKSVAERLVKVYEEAIRDQKHHLPSNGR